MPRLPYMQLWVGDFLASTSHLSLEQRGGYMLVMMAMWNAGGSLPNEPAKLARVCGISLKRWQHISPEILEFFELQGDRLTQKRLAAEYQKQSEIIEKRSAAGKLGNSVKSLKINNTASANATANEGLSERMSTSSPESTSESEKKEEGGETVTQPMSLPAMKPARPHRNKKPLISTAALEPAFQEFMQSYPRPVDEDAARRAYKSALRDRRGTAEEILAGAKRYAALQRGNEPRFIKAPQNWLAAGSWRNPEVGPSTSIGMSTAHGMPNNDPTIAGFNRRLPA